MTDRGGLLGSPFGGKSARHFATKSNGGSHEYYMARFFYHPSWEKRGEKLATVTYDVSLEMPRTRDAILIDKLCDTGDKLGECWCAFCIIPAGNQFRNTKINISIIRTMDHTYRKRTSRRTIRVRAHYTIQAAKTLSSNKTA